MNKKKYKEFIEENKLYKYYKLYAVLDKGAFTPSARKKYYISNCDTISEVLAYILSNNSYDVLKIRHRETKDFVLGERDSLSEYLKRTFGGRVLVEHAIQRNIYVNREKYIEELGEIVGYEVNLPYEPCLAKVDLMSYKDGYLYLIELKKCKVAPSKKDSKEQLVRAIMEIETYNSFMDTETIKNIQQTPELKDKEIKGIKKMILASRNIFDDYHFISPELKKYIDDNIVFKYISCEKDILSMNIGTSEKLFSIGDVKL